MTDKELEMLEEEATAQIPSTNAKKILKLIATIREQREWLKRKNEALKNFLIPSGICWMKATEGFAEQWNREKDIIWAYQVQKFIAIGSEQTSEI